MLDTREERDKFELLYKEYRSTVFAVAKGVLNSDEEAEDVTQDTFLKIIPILDRINPKCCGKTKSFFVTIARNKSIDRIRYQKHISQMELEEVELYHADMDAPPLEAVLSEEGYRKLLGYISELNDTYKDICRLRLVYEFSEKEIAALLDISPSTVNMRIYRARHILQERIRKEEKNGK